MTHDSARGGFEVIPFAGVKIKVRLTISEYDKPLLMREVEISGQYVCMAEKRDKACVEMLSTAVECLGHAAAEFLDGKLGKVG